MVAPKSVKALEEAVLVREGEHLPQREASGSPCGEEQIWQQATSQCRSRSTALRGSVEADRCAAKPLEGATDGPRDAHVNDHRKGCSEVGSAPPLGKERC